MAVKKAVAQPPAMLHDVEQAIIALGNTLMSKKNAYKEPKNPGPAGDELYKTRELRYALNKIVAELDSRESAIRDYLVKVVPKSQASGVSGKLAQIKIETKEKPTVEDRAKFTAYIKRTGAFDLMTGAINAKAIEARWEDGKVIPGVGKYIAVTVSCTKK